MCFKSQKDFLLQERAQPGSLSSLTCALSPSLSLPSPPGTLLSFGLAASRKYSLSCPKLLYPFFTCLLASVDQISNPPLGILFRCRWTKSTSLFLLDRNRFMFFMPLLASFWACLETARLGWQPLNPALLPNSWPPVDSPAPSSVWPSPSLFSPLWSFQKIGNLWALIHLASRVLGREGRLFASRMTSLSPSLWRWWGKKGEFSPTS